MQYIKFWGRLSDQEADRLYSLLNEYKNALIRLPDEKLAEMELLAMKGWTMFIRCPWSGEICSCEQKGLGFPWKEDNKLPARCLS